MYGSRLKSAESYISIAYSYAAVHFLSKPLYLIQSQAESCSSSTSLCQLQAKAILNCRKMKKPPIFPRDESGNCNELGYDLQLDFSKFLEEARNHASDTVFSLPQSYSSGKAKRKDGKKKKTWIRSLSFWFKFQKSAREETPPKTKSLKHSNISGAEHRPFSGPLFGNGSRFAHLHQKIRDSTSGPLASCFTPTRAEETEVPYRYLGHQNHPLGAQAFGPIYLVT